MMGKDKGSEITVIGLGGAGCNTINRLSQFNLPNVKLVAANTDLQSLNATDANEKILIGPRVTKGLGSGGNDQIGREAAEESFREIFRSLQGAEIAFLTAGMGGGTGSGAIEITARIAKSMNIKTIAIVTLPFSFESGCRTIRAREATLRLQGFSDTLITIPNDKLIEMAAFDLPFKTALAISDEYLINSIQSISALVQAKGLLNVDMSHVSRALSQRGGTYISMGICGGKKRAVQAIDIALNHPLIQKVSLQDARFVILQLTGLLSINEIEAAMNHLHTILPEETEIIPAFDPTDIGSGKVRAIILATGVGAFSIPEFGVEFKDRQTDVPLTKPVNEQMVDHFQYSPVDMDMDDYEVPAFIRKGYNLQESQVH